MTWAEYERYLRQSPTIGLLHHSQRATTHNSYAGSTINGMVAPINAGTNEREEEDGRSSGEEKGPDCVAASSAAQAASTAGNVLVAMSTFN